MREITRQMIDEFQMKKLGYDFMGYDFQRERDLSFHHLIIPHRKCHGMPAEGYTRNNGAILRQNTSHDYLHTIERYDYDRFMAITSEMIDENIIGRLDKQSLLRIHDILTSFEREYCGTEYKGKRIIKEEYTKRLTKKWE